jgi:hypothetical protein
LSGGPFAAWQNLASFVAASPFSWSSITRSAEANDSNANDDETKKEMGLVSKERQLARLRERMADEGVIAVARLGQVAVPCRRCVDRVVAP